MTVVIHVVTGVQRHLDGQRVHLHIHYAEAAPRLLREHNLLLVLVHEWLDVGTLLLVGYQNSLR